MNIFCGDLLQFKIAKFQETQEGAHVSMWGGLV